VDLHRADGGYDVRECGIAGLVPRCGVAGISADGVVYVGALKFDPPCDLPWPERFRKD
jgi:hypothetical protein